MKCPKCGSALTALTITAMPSYGGEVLDSQRVEGQMVVDQCFSCRGVWFDANELEAYLNEKLMVIHSEKVPKTSDYNVTPGPCPKCQKTMDQKPFKAGVFVDVCSTCHGIWLDGGELDRLEANQFSFAERWGLLKDMVKQRFDKSEG